MLSALLLAGRRWSDFSISFVRDLQPLTVLWKSSSEREKRQWKLGRAERVRLWSVRRSDGLWSHSAGPKSPGVLTATAIVIAVRAFADQGNG
jgi:hypothetical protein